MTVADYTSPGGSFVTYSEFETAQTQKTLDKKVRATEESAMTLAANLALRSQVKTSLLAADLALRARMVTDQTTIVNSLAASKSATTIKANSVRNKLDAAATTIANAKLESARTQTRNREARLADVRALEDHQTVVQNRLDAARQATLTKKAAQRATIVSKMAQAQFKMNQLRSSNGPTIAPGNLKKMSCTVDQFNRNECSEVTNPDTFLEDAPTGIGSDVKRG